MNWDLAIKRNSKALKAIIDVLFALLGLDGTDAASRIPRSLHSAVLGVLRPAESAVRRLIVIAARGVVVELAPPRSMPAGKIIGKVGGSRPPSFQLFDPLVSETDRACEDEIVSALNRMFPGDAFLGEERGLQNAGGDATWVIDPIGGTANFLRGIPLRCVSLGLVFRNVPILGIIYNPQTDELYAAKHGSGATLNRARIKASAVTKLSEARMGIGFSYRRPIAPHVHASSALLDAHCEYSRLGSGALGMAFTADGRLDGYWEAHINIWDVAAGLCIVKEADGWTNDFMSGDVFHQGNPILATNRGLADSLSTLLAKRD